MEFVVFGAWMPYLLMIMGGCLILSVLLLFISIKYSKKKVKELEEDDDT